MDFIVADYESEEEASAYLSRGTKEYSVLIDPELLEEMAADGKTKEKQEIYIGKTNIFDEQYNVAVADWRAPISSVYYDGEIGETEYICPEGKIKGNLLLKRQFQIEEGELKSYNNITLTANDELLQECLNEKSDSKLRNIVATIQKSKIK